MPRPDWTLKGGRVASKKNFLRVRVSQTPETAAADDDSIAFITQDLVNLIKHYIPMLMKFSHKGPKYMPNRLVPRLPILEHSYGLKTRLAPNFTIGQLPTCPLSTGVFECRVFFLFDSNTRISLMIIFVFNPHLENRKPLAWH